MLAKVGCCVSGAEVFRTVSAGWLSGLFASLPRSHDELLESDSWHDKIKRFAFAGRGVRNELRFVGIYGRKQKVECNEAVFERVRID